MRLRVLATAAAVCFYLQAAAPASAAEDVEGACQGLLTVPLAHGTISQSESVKAGTFRPPTPEPPGAPPNLYAGLADFCRVSGVLSPSADSHILFELWLPESGWNNHFLQVGNGGAAGSIIYSALAAGLQKGYAVTNTDTGHSGGVGDFSWAEGHPEKLTDYAYRAVHEVTLAARALTTAFYRQPPDKSFWNGCSTGGRQGLMEAQRYPEDYDAIIAGAPANNWGPLMALSIQVKRNVGVPEGLPVSKLNLLKEAAIAQCDANDGVVDRVISEPARCKFDPGTLACKAAEEASCLTQAQVLAARNVYAGVSGKSGTAFFPGTGVGSEPAWGFYASPRFPIGSNFFQAVGTGDPNWAPANFDADRDVPRLQAKSVDIAATSPDVSAYLDRGGKLMLYHGTTDGLIPYRNTESYYKGLANKLGRSTRANQIRFFTVPGMDHCFGGEGASVVDWLGAMERWELSGAAPEVLSGSRPSSGQQFTRPICAYPTSARYLGRGNPSDAANWRCVAR
jgi:feruloyl esterase